MSTRIVWARGNRTVTPHAYEEWVKCQIRSCNARATHQVCFPRYGRRNAVTQARARCTPCAKLFVDRFA